MDPIGTAHGSVTSGPVRARNAPCAPVMPARRASQDRLYNGFDHLEAALDEFKANRDAAQHKAARDKSEATMKGALEVLSRQASQLQAGDAALAAKVAELARLMDDKLSKVRRLHAEVANAIKANAKDVAGQVKPLVADVDSVSSQVDAVVSSLDK